MDAATSCALSLLTRSQKSEAADGYGGNPEGTLSTIINVLETPSVTQPAIPVGRTIGFQWSAIVHDRAT